MISRAKMIEDLTLKATLQGVEASPEEIESVVDNAQFEYVVQGSIIRDGIAAAFREQAKIEGRSPISDQEMLQMLERPMSRMIVHATTGMMATFFGTSSEVVADAIRSRDLEEVLKALTVLAQGMGVISMVIRDMCGFDEESQDG